MTIRACIFSRLCTYTLCVLMGLSPATAGLAYAQTGGAGKTEPAPPPPSEYPRGDRHGDSRGEALLPALITGLFAILGQQQNTGKDDKRGANEEDLALNGPRMLDSYPVGTFAVYGFTNDGWPLVVDFLPKPNSCTWLDVMLNQERVFSRLLDMDGRSGRRLVRVDLPHGITKQARAALYIVQSEQRSCDAGAAPPAPVEVYGIGAGPRAIGSVAVDQLLFEPALPRVPQEPARISYRVKSNFNHASVEILRYLASPSGLIQVQRVRANRADALSPGLIVGQPWDGQDQSGKRSLGVHRLQVRAWFNEGDPSWVGAISPASVTIAPR
ncbi:hypothetical protein [Janthinobacterium fluminis]|uniref:Uncharacterized protein n=1 Tax=Janthinobacterium fluminis TaxID=2987524 RepID=A0ABT5K5H8_9BURK|nr:hypothetical protein [Janthinobacterium fluminis]MDC8759673.1 hypothetical protein [Janthinobacterium fluminis]